MRLCWRKQQNPSLASSTGSCLAIFHIWLDHTLLRARGAVLDVIVSYKTKFLIKIFIAGAVCIMFTNARQQQHIEIFLFISVRLVVEIKRSLQFCLCHGHSLWRLRLLLIHSQDGNNRCSGFYRRRSVEPSRDVGVQFDTFVFRTIVVFLVDRFE